MIIGIKEAIDKFYNNPSFDLIYSEAMANALDAGASSIVISIKTKGYENVGSLEIQIEDNGIGFNEHNFDNFCHLLKTEDSHHKGLGRLVYLKYFQNVHIESVYSGNRKRVFDFNSSFVNDKQDSQLDKPSENSTKLIFTKFCNDRLRSYDNLIASKIKTLLMKQFLPRLYALKQQQKAFSLTVAVSTDEEKPAKGFVNEVVTMTLDDLPVLEELPIQDSSLDLFASDFKMLYRIEDKNYYGKTITAICVDGRAVELPLLKDSLFPVGVSATFLLQSSFFDSKVNDSRQGVTLEPQDQEIIEQIFSEKISEILNLKVPSIKQRNKETKEHLFARYPHLEGFFQQESIGLIDEEKSINRAQAAFFKEQKEVLGATQLTDAQYELSLNHSTRILTEYFLYRNLIVNKLKEINADDPEKTIHQLIAPMQREFSSDHFYEDIYNNNAWLLDDKYMTYRYVLSDLNIKQLVEKVSTDKELQFDDLRPDIAFVFSEDIETVDHPVDVIVVELKKKNLSYLEDAKVINQIKQRARRLVAFYPNKIQRMWFFGIVDFDDELMSDIEDEHWIPIYSAGTVYYKEIDSYPRDKNKKRISEIPVPVSVTLMSHDALWKDAQNRNNTFLNILKSSIRSFVEAKESKANKS